MVKAFNKVALLVPTEILDETTPQARAKVLSMYIKVSPVSVKQGLGVGGFNVWDSGMIGCSSV